MNDIEHLYKTVADRWIKVINDDYENIKKGFILSCSKEMTDFNEDIFHTTIINCYSTILKSGITDLTVQGMKNYLFRAFKQNIKREAVYSRNRCRDTSKTDSDIFHMLDNVEDGVDNVLKQKMDDYTVMKILDMVEDRFDTISFYCFRLKWLMPSMTYSRLRDITKVKDCKKRCNEIMRWCKENINKNEIITDFDKEYV